jgi:hypothetical protein
MKRNRKLSLAAGSLAGPALLLAVSQAIASTGGITEYQAVYDVSYGSFSGTGTFGVSAERDNEYVFASSIKIKGLVARTLLGKDPALEGSRFRLVGDGISPQRFWYEDGTRKGESNFTIDFDADGGAIRIAGTEVAKTLPFQDGLLDRGSLQVALMRDLAACTAPGPYRYVDDDGITSYTYEQLENRPAETGIGTLDTVRFEQQHAGSGRSTILWLAPDYAFVPVRIERFDDGELEWTFALDSLSGIEPAPTDCSGFR